MKLIKKSGDGLEYDVVGGEPGQGSGGGGGGVELKTLNVTVTFNGSNHVFDGFISSEIPENTVITEIIKIERVDVQGSGQSGINIYTPLPSIEGRTDISNNFVLDGYEAFGKMDPVSPSFPAPLGLVFAKIDMHTESTEFTETLKITYV